MKITGFIILLLLAFISVFEFHPVIEQGQSYVSQESYQNKTASCRAILANRPWYGKLNHWFIVWIILIPTLVFSLKPSASKWMRAGRVLVAISVCYLLLNLAVGLQWDIRNAPFSADPFTPDPMNGWRRDCVNVADGFSLLLAYGFAWVPACVYTGFWMYLWNQYHRVYIQDESSNFKFDFVSHWLFICLRWYAFSIIAFIALTPLAKLYYN